MATLGAGDGLGRLPTLVPEASDIARQLGLLGPCHPLADQLAMTVARTARDDLVAKVGEFDVGIMGARAARDRDALRLLGLGETIARLQSEWTRATKLCASTSTAAFQLGLEPSHPLAKQLAELARTARRDARLAEIPVGGFDVGMMAALPAPLREMLRPLRETIEQSRSIELSALRSRDRLVAQHTAPPPHPVTTLGAALAAAVRGCVTITTLLDPATESLVIEEVASLLASSSTPAWHQRAERTAHATARQRALLEAIVDAREPQPRLRIGTKEYGQNRAAITLAPADRDRWVWQRARGVLSGKVRRERLPTPSPADALADTIEMERLLTLTLPTDPSWSEDATPLLGSVVLEVWDQLVPEDRALIQTALKAQLRRTASLPE
jgi:hypothetical protein